MLFRFHPCLFARFFFRLLQEGHSPYRDHVSWTFFMNISATSLSWWTMCANRVSASCSCSPDWSSPPSHGVADDSSFCRECSFQTSTSTGRKNQTPRTERLVTIRNNVVLLPCRFIFAVPSKRASPVHWGNPFYLSQTLNLQHEILHIRFAGQNIRISYQIANQFIIDLFFILRCSLIISVNLHKLSANWQKFMFIKTTMIDV